MNHFCDKDGGKWVVDINVGTVKQVKTILGVDIMDMVSENSNLLASLYEDPIMLVDMLFVLCKSQADAKEIDDVMFASLFNGDTIESATEALIEGLLSFFPPRRREVLRKMQAKFRMIESAAMEKANEELDAVDIEKILKDAVEQTKSGTQFTPVVQS